tara:strand:+ start:2313 stop:2552 length:240 start_codon:yes stop_codon:yes gene_type:complete
MNKKTNQPKTFDEYDVRAGDLVKIKTYDWEGVVELNHGVVIERLSHIQQSMFPVVKVYIFERQTAEELYSYNIEVISRM